MRKKTLFNCNSLIYFFYLWISGSNSFSCISTPTSIEHLCREPGPWLMSGDAAKSGELLGGVDRRSAIVYLHVIFTIWIVVSQVSLNFSAFPSYQSCIDVSVDSTVIVLNIKCTSSPIPPKHTHTQGADVRLKLYHGSCIINIMYHSPQERICRP